jgi:hypothetical protein
VEEVAEVLGITFSAGGDGGSGHFEPVTITQKAAAVFRDGLSSTYTSFDGSSSK